MPDITISLTQNQYDALMRITKDPELYIQKNLTTLVRRKLQQYVGRVLKDGRLKSIDQDTLRNYIRDNNLELVHWEDWPIDLLARIAKVAISDELPRP